MTSGDEDKGARSIIRDAHQTGNSSTKRNSINK